MEYEVEPRLAPIREVGPPEVDAGIDAGNLPVGPVRAMIFVGFVLFISQIFSEMIKSGFVLIRREDLAELKQVDAPARIE